MLDYRVYLKIRRELIEQGKSASEASEQAYREAESLEALCEQVRKSQTEAQKIWNKEVIRGNEEEA